MKPMRLGVLGASNFAITRTIPAMLEGERTQIEAIASRSLEKAQATASRFGIPKAYGSYEELLADPEIDIIYNPLPISLHQPWNIKALQAGKHVLCEKPLAENAGQVRELIAVAASTGKRLMEAFMVRHHPQWHRAIELLRGGRIGTVQSLQAHVCFNITDPANIRNQKALAGGGLMDIGCYAVHTSRWVFGSEPQRVIALLQKDEQFGTDKLVSGIMEFPQGQAVFTSASQIPPFQRMMIHGSQGHLEIPFLINPTPELPAKLLIYEGDATNTLTTEVLEMPVVNHYTLQGDQFCQGIEEGTPQVLPLEDSLENTKVLEALFRSAESGSWETP